MGKGSYIVSYFDDDDDDDDVVKEKLIPVIILATGTISRSFRKYLSNRSGKHEIKEVQKRNISILDITHIRNSESTNAKAQSICIVCNNITCSKYCK